MNQVGRAPIRKVGRKERFVGPAHYLAEQGDKYIARLGAIEQALRFTDVEGDDEGVDLSKIWKHMDTESVVRKVCALKESDRTFGEVVETVKKIQRGIRLMLKSMATINVRLR